ncbi:MAG: phage minor head protein [Candidatus Gastranaerophilaceae bacterium]
MTDIDLKKAFYMEPKEIVKYFESKGLKPSFDWHEVYEDAHAKAFTVAKMTQTDLLKDTHDMLTTAIKEGWSEGKFQKNATELFQRKGWVGKQEVVNPKTGEQQTVELGTPRRIKQIFQCNMHSAYAVGRYKSQMEKSDVAPYFQYSAILDGKTRPEHKAMHGKVFRYDDPIWNTMYPPNGWHCRCTVKQLTKSDVRRKGLTVESSENHLREVTEIVGGEEKPNTVYTFSKNGNIYELKPDAGWATNLGLFDYIPDLEKYNYDIASRTADVFVNSKVFNRFCNRCSILAKKIEEKAVSDLTKNNQKLTTGAIQNYAVKNLLNKKYSNLIKKTTFDIAVLNEEQKNLLKTNRQTLKLSAETLIKELIKHKDLNIDNFRQISPFLKNSDVMIYENPTENLLCFKLSNKFFIIALKSTKDKTINFVKTFHLSNLKDLQKELKKANNTVIFDKLNIKKE